MSNLCNNCKNCVILNQDRGIVITEHASGKPYDWQKFNEPVCKLLCVGMKEVKKCDHYKEIKIKVVN